MRFLFLAALVVLGLAPARAAAEDEAQPPGALIRVRARSELSLTVTKDAVRGGAVRLRVELRDGPSQKPLAAQAIVLTMAARSLDPPPRRHPRLADRLYQTVVTDEEGRASLEHRLWPGRYQVQAKYAGDAVHDRVEVEQLCDLGRRPVRLGLLAPERVPLGETLAIEATLVAEGAGPPPSGPTRFFIDGQEQPLPLREGRGELSLPLTPFAPGPLKGLHAGAELHLLLRFEGDAEYGAAQQERKVLLTSRARVRLDSPRSPSGGAEAAQGGALTLSGSASDEEGPLGEEPFEIWAQLDGDRQSERRLLGQGLTDGLGRIRLHIDRLPLKPGMALLSAQVTPRRSFREPGASAPVSLLVQPPEPRSIGFFLIPLCATAALLLGGLAYRKRSALRHLAARLLQFVWLPRPPDEAAALSQTGQGGVRMTQRSRVQALLGSRRPEWDLQGTVMDAAFGVPVTSAQLVLERPEGPPEVLTVDAQGRFERPGLTGGTYAVRVEAPGYLPEAFSAALPHRGELRGVQIALSPIRVHILAQWQQVAGPLLPQRAQPATWTPRELLDHFRQQLREQAQAQRLEPLLRLTDLVEESFYSARPSTAAMLKEAEQLRQQVQVPSDG